MAKAILVIDEPKYCAECSCWFCAPLQREMGIWSLQNGKPMDCPLKPMPVKHDNVPKHEYELGWNDCIEEIEG